MAKFKVGDRVRVKPYADMVREGRVGESGSVCGIPGKEYLEEYSGRMFRINRVYTSGAYILADGEGLYAWPDYALEPAPHFKYTPEVKAKLENPHSTYSPPVQMSVSYAVDDVSRKLEDGAYQAVVRCGITVDKDELIRALHNDRCQFEKGYAAGYADGMKAMTRVVESKYGVKVEV